jgi:uncharacterized spore protein YtfJ
VITESQAEQVPRRRADELIAGLADRLGARFGVSSVFGEPVQRDGVTVIPVATVRFGFGGGTGSDPAKQQEGEGAGGGGSLTASGYIELKDGRTRFVPIVRPERMVALAFLAMLAILLRTRPAAPARKRRLPIVP